MLWKGAQAKFFMSFNTVLMLSSKILTVFPGLLAPDILSFRKWSKAVPGAEH